MRAVEAGQTRPVVPQDDRGRHRRNRALAAVIGLLWMSSIGALYLQDGMEPVDKAAGPPIVGVGDPPVEAEQPTPGAVFCDVAPADGHAAITAAIAGCADGTTVRFPTGRTYHQTHAIVVEGRRNLVIDGNGSTFISSAPNESGASIYQARPNWQIVEGVEVTLRNLTVRGNLPAGARGILAGNQYNAGIMIYGGDGIRIADVSVFSVFGEFVVSNPSGFFHGKGALEGQVPRNVQIDRLSGASAARQCVAVTAARGFHLRDSTLRDCYQNGVDIEPDVAGEPVHDVHIVGNTISGFRFAGVAVPTAYASGDVDRVEIAGNTISASDTCYPAVLLGGVQANRNPLFEIVVADNRLDTLFEGVKATRVASGHFARNRITIRASPNLCGPPAGVPVRLIESPNVSVESNTAVGYGA